MLKKKGIILIFGILLISLASAGIYDDCEIYGTCETARDIISAINYTTINVNNSIFWDGNPFSYLGDNFVPYTGATANLIMPDYTIWGKTLRGDDVFIWDDTLNADAILTMYTHDISNTFVIDVNDAGSTDFYSTDQYQIRSGDNLFQIIHNLYTGTFLNIDVGNTFPEITSKDGVISFVSDNLTTTGNVTASNFFGNIDASFVQIALGSGSPTIDQMQEYLDNTGSSGFFLGGDLSDGGAGTVDVSAGSGFIRTTDDQNAELQSFKWDAVSGLAVPDDTTQYVYVNNTGDISLSQNEFLEAPNKIKIGVVTDEAGSTIHFFKLGVRLEESIGEAGRYIRRVHGIERNIRLGGLIMGQSSDVNRDVTMTSGQLEWGRTSYPISPFDTSGADTFFTYSASGLESSTASQWDNLQYDNAGTLTNLGNNKWANSWFFLEPDGHLIMIYGREQHNTQSSAEQEGVPSLSLPSRVSETSILVSRFIFQKSSDIAIISSAFDTLFANAGVTDVNDLANIGTDFAPQYVLADGSRPLTANWQVGEFDITNASLIQTINLNVTGTSYLGNMIIEADNITVDNLLNLSSNGIKVWGNLFVDGNVGINTINPETLLDVSGNTPTTNTAQFGTFGIQSSSVANGFLTANGFFDSSDFIYRENGRMGVLQFVAGRFLIRNAVSGTAGNPATIITQLEVEQDGDILVNNGNFQVPTHTPTRLTGEFGGFGIQSLNNLNGFLMVNGEWDGSDMRYRNNGQLALLQFAMGDIYFRGSPTGTAGNVATLTTNMFIKNEGEVGINTSNPQNTLNVIGDGNFTGVVYRDNKLLIDWSEATNGTLFTQVLWDTNYSANNEAWLNITNTSYALDSVLNNGSYLNVPQTTENSTSWNRSGTDVFLANTGDNVGIGTETPDELLTLSHGAAEKAIKIIDTTSNNFLTLGHGNSYVNIFGGTSSTGMLFGFDTPLLANAKMTILRDGKVGIGTSNPISTLHVNGSGAVIGGDFNNYASLTESSFVIDIDGSVGGTVLGSHNGTSRQKMEFQGSKYEFETGINSGNYNYFVIDSDGKVGIGTTSPNDLLEINSTVEPSLSFHRTDATVGDNNGIGWLKFVGAEDGSDNIVAAVRAVSDGAWTATSSPTEMWFYTTETNAVTGSIRMVINKDGRVGIGTTTPGLLLHLNNSAPFIRFEESDSSNKIWNIGGSSGDFRISEDAGLTSRVTFQAGGNVGIGVTDPDVRLEVLDEIHIDGLTNAFLNIDRNADTNAGRIRFQTAGTDDFEIGLKGGMGGFHITDGSVNSLLIIDSSGNLTISSLAGGDGSSYVCVDASGVLFSQEGAC